MVVNALHRLGTRSSSFRGKEPDLLLFPHRGLAQVVRRLGGEAVVIEGADRVMPREAAPMGQALGEALRPDGIELVLGKHATAVRKEGDDYVLQLDDGSELRGDRPSGLVPARGVQGQAVGTPRDQLQHGPDHAVLGGRGEHAVLVARSADPAQGHREAALGPAAAPGVGGPHDGVHSLAAGCPRPGGSRPCSRSWPPG